PGRLMNDKALLNAVKRGDLLEVRCLLRDGADPNATPRGFAPPVNLAAARGHLPILKTLLEAGAKADLRTVRSAAYGSHPPALRLLLAAGAPPDTPRGTT